MALTKANRVHVALLFSRLVFGGMMLLAHGIPKISGFPNPGFPDPFGVGATVSMGLAIFAETICALFVCLGLWTRLALIPLIVTMLTAVFIIHGDDPFQKMELGLMYLFAYIAIFIAGPGEYAVDRKLSKNI